MRRLWNALLDWMDESTGLKITTVEITRFNVLLTVFAFIGSVVWGWYAGSWRTFALLFGGYFLGALIGFMIREQRGEG